MSNEIADALRRFADDIDAGKACPNAMEACIVLANDAGQCSATYIGRKVPSRDAGIFLLASGTQRFIQGMQSSTAAAPPAAAGTSLFGTGVNRGSTH